MAINIHGTRYATVSDRLGVAHAGDRPSGIQAIETEFRSVGSFTLCVATVTFIDGRRFSGTAELTLGQGHGPQAQAPLETCETSAVGRALAFAGYPGSETGLAGAEEVAVAQARGVRPIERRQDARPVATDDTPFEPSVPVRLHATNGNGERRVQHADAPATDAQLGVIASIARTLGETVDVDDLTRQQASELIEELGERRRARGATPARGRGR